MSILFPLSLRGYGTYEIESISSYVHRVACIHHVSVGQLLNYSFGWYSEKHGCHLSHDYGACGKIAALSRPKSSSEDLIKVLSYVTGEKNLRSGTFLPVDKALDRAVGQFASNIRWCPSCMQEYALAEDPGYFKLIWTLLDITHCPEHRVALIDKCPECDSHQDGFGKKTICRVCQKCGASLGWYAKPNEIIPSWEVNGMDLVRFVDKLAKNPNINYPEDGLRKLLSSVFDKAWERQEEDLLWSKIPRDEYLGLTCGNTTVSLQVARRLSARLGVELHDLLMADSDSLTGLLEPAWFKDIPKEFKSKKRKTRHNRDEIFEKLLGYTSDAYKDIPLPFAQVAKLMGVSKGYLEYHFPEICKTLSERYRNWEMQELLKKRQLAWAEALQYFNRDSDAYPNLSKTEALKSIREKTGLPKNMLREEINAIYALLFDNKISITH
jgi:hypothetical protein